MEERYANQYQRNSWSNRSWECMQRRFIYIYLCDCFLTLPGEEDDTVLIRFIMTWNSGLLSTSFCSGRDINNTPLSAERDLSRSARDCFLPFLLDLHLSADLLRPRRGEVMWSGGGMGMGSVGTSTGTSLYRVPLMEIVQGKNENMKRCTKFGLLSVTELSSFLLPYLSHSWNCLYYTTHSIIYFKHIYYFWDQTSSKLLYETNQFNSTIVSWSNSISEISTL